MRTYLISPGFERQELEGTNGHHTIRYCLNKLSDDLRDSPYPLCSIEREGYLYPEDLLADISAYNPDTVVHVPHDKWLSLECVAAIRSSFSGKFICILTDNSLASMKSLEYFDEVWISNKELFSNCKNKEDSRYKYVPHCSVPENYYPVECEKIYDVTFVGRANDIRGKYLAALKDAGYRLNIRGLGWEEYPELIGCCRGYLLHYEYLETLSSSKIVLNFCHDGDNEDFVLKSRVFESACSGVFQICNGGNELGDYFTPGEDLVTFTDENDLVSKVEYYLSRFEERDVIAKSGYTKSKDHLLIKEYAKLLNLEIKENGISEAKTFSVIQAADSPKVSVLTCVYNEERYIKEMIESVLTQTFTDFEFIIINDGSTDNTDSIISNYLSDKRIKYFKQENTGKNLLGFDKLRKQLVDLSVSNILAIMDGDDIMHPERLEKQYAAFQQNNSVDVVFSEACVLDAYDNVVSRGIPPEYYDDINNNNVLLKFFEHNLIAFPTVMIKKSSLLKAGGFQTPFASDYYFWLLTVNRFKYHVVPDILLGYRKHDGNASLGMRSPRKLLTKELITLMRSYYTIVDFFPDIESEPENYNRISEAYVSLANLWQKSDSELEELSIMETEYAEKYKIDSYTIKHNKECTV